jgi:hypothetical protein
VNARTARSPKVVLADTITRSGASMAFDVERYSSLVFGIAVTAVRGDHTKVNFQLETSFDDGANWFPYGPALAVTASGRWLLCAGAGDGGDFGVLVRVAFEVSGLDATAITKIWMIGK